MKAIKRASELGPTAQRCDCCGKREVQRVGQFRVTHLIDGDHATIPDIWNLSLGAEDVCARFIATRIYYTPQAIQAELCGTHLSCGYCGNCQSED